MEVLREDIIIIRGTGRRAKRLMNRLDVYKELFPKLYEWIRGKIYCVIDADQQKTEKRFNNIPVHGVDVILGCNGTILYVVAVADYLQIFDEINSYNNPNIRVITDNEFIHEINNALQNSVFFTYENELTEGIKRVIQNKYNIGRIISEANRDNDALPINMVKALFFLQEDNVLTNNEILVNDVEKNIIPQDDKKVVGMFATTISGGGAERVISHLTKSFIKQGYKVVIFIERTDDNEYNTQEGTEYVRFKYKLSDDFNSCMEERYKRLKEKKINVACFHIPYEGYMLFYEVYLCKLMGIRTIVEYHTSFINALVQRGGLLANRKTYLLADKLVVLSKTDEVFWRNIGVDAQYIPNPFITSLKNEEKIDEDGKHILLWVGKINQKYKRVFDLIPIMEEIKKRVPTAKLYVLGSVIDQEEADSFRKMIIDKGLEDNIVICGFQKNVENYYRRASVMLMTSPGEGFPMALAEAKTFGLPTVMYDLPYLELVKDGLGIVTVNKGDITRFAYEVVSLLENDNRRRMLSDQARKSAEYYINYDIALAWKNVIEGVETKEMSVENKREERALIWRLIDECRIDMNNKELEEICALNLEKYLSKEA